MTNTVVDHINKVGHVRWVYPGAQYYWFVGGETADPELESMLRYRITRDLSTLGARNQRLVKKSVALLTQNFASPIIMNMLRKRPGWESIVFGEKGLTIDNAEKICCRTSHVILCYGEPSERLHDLVNELSDTDSPPELVTRKIEKAGKAVQSLVKDSEPYSHFKADVERLSHHRPNPTKGLQIRDEIDMRPQYKL